MDQLHAYAVASGLSATKCSVWTFFIGDHPRNQEIGISKEIGKGKFENKKSDNQEIGIGQESELRNRTKKSEKSQEIRAKNRRITNESNGKYLSVMPFARVSQDKSVSRQTSRRHRQGLHFSVQTLPQIFPLTRSLYGPKKIRNEERNRVAFGHWRNEEMGKYPSSAASKAGL